MPPTEQKLAVPTKALVLALNQSLDKFLQLDKHTKQP